MKPIAELFKVEWNDVATWGLSDDCQGWNSDAALFDKLVEQTQAHTVIEVGTWKGRSAIHMARAMREHWLRTTSDRKDPGCLYCVDTWQGGIDHLLSDLAIDQIERENGYPVPLYRQFLWNVSMAGCCDIIQPVPVPSAIGAKLLAAHSVQADLIYIDGAHDHDGAYADISGFWPLLRPGGIMFGDDVNMPGVYSAVARFMSSADVKTVVRSDPFWQIRKPGLD